MYLEFVNVNESRISHEEGTPLKKQSPFFLNLDQEGIVPWDLFYT